MAQNVTREEFELVKDELEKLAIKHEVLASGVDGLRQEVGQLREDLGDLREQMDARFDRLTDEVNSRFSSLEMTQTAILSAVMKLLPRG